MTVVCLYEDRPEQEIGLRLAIASLARRWPGIAVVVFCASASAELRRWLQGRNGVELITDFSAPLRGWDAKPYCLLALLDRGAREVIWLDTDIIVTAAFRTTWAEAGDDTVVVAQEPGHLPRQGTANRATAWALEAKREIGFTLNGSVIRFTSRHRTLLERWHVLLGTPAYRAAQAQPMLERPFHLTSDQDVLGALLSSAEFAVLPVRILRAGRDIVHSGGLLMDPPRARFRRLGGGGSQVRFVHAIAVKPWTLLAPGSGERNFDWWLLRLMQELSAYVAHARGLRAEVGAPCPWLDYATLTGRVFRLAGCGSDAWRGLPISVALGVLHRLGWDRRSR